MSCCGAQKRLQFGAVHARVLGTAVEEESASASIAQPISPDPAREDVEVAAHAMVRELDIA
jgi:hypothetical protein